MAIGVLIKGKRMSRITPRGGSGMRGGAAER